MKNEEIWKYIPQFDGYLQASNLGNIREFIQILKSDNLIHIEKNKPILIYKKGMISYKGKELSAPRLIYSAFYEIPKLGCRTTFRDGNPMNRSPENLLFTSINNAKKAEQNHNAKLSSVKVYELC